MPRYDVRTCHSRTAATSPKRLWDAATRVRVRDTRTLRPVIAVRLGAHAPQPETTFRELFRSPPFILLDDRPGELSVSGGAGPLWSPRAGFAEFTSPDDFREFEERGNAKVAFFNGVRPHARGAELVSEARVWCVDPGARALFRALWLVVGQFERFIGSEPLSAAVRIAERPARRRPAAGGRSRR
jgi:hypothetical protein